MINLVSSSSLVFELVLAMELLLNFNIRYSDSSFTPLDVFQPSLLHYHRLYFVTSSLLVLLVAFVLGFPKRYCPLLMYMYKIE